MHSKLICLRIAYSPRLSLRYYMQIWMGRRSSFVNGGGCGGGYDDDDNNNHNCDACDENSRPTAATVMNCDVGNSDSNVWDFINYSEGNFWLKSFRINYV